MPGLLEKLNLSRLFKGRKQPEGDLSDIFKAKYERFKELLDSNAELSRIIADIEVKLQGYDVFGMSYIRSQTARAVFHTLRMIRSLNALSGNRYAQLLQTLNELNEKIKEDLESRRESSPTELVLPYSRITREMVDWVGGKNANLGEVLNRVNLPIPEGFAVTTRAFETFLARNELVDEINKLKMEIVPGDPETLNTVSEEIQRLIITAPVPDELREAILAAYDKMAADIQSGSATRGQPCVSMRSSAIGEDSELSYAGQYLSMLNVPREKLIQTYNFIVASLYTPRAISYRLNKGIRDEDIAMSVACLRMLESVCSGIAYSRDPVDFKDNAVIITSVWGLGPYAVDGVITPDTCKVARNTGLEIIRETVSHKPVQLVTNPDGGLMEVPVPPERVDAPCLSANQVKLLAGYALSLEKHYGCAQDIEWALDRDGRILILQTRPLKLEVSDSHAVRLTDPDPARHPMLVENAAIAYPGVGSGKAFQVLSEEDLPNFPDGGVLVARHSSPKFVVVMPKAAAIITDFGSVTGHMASLAREFRVPTLLDAQNGTLCIQTGMEVTVDGFSGRVYGGRVSELLDMQVPKVCWMRGTPVHDTLKRVSDVIVPLRLVNPKSPEFTPGQCRSLHDIMRFVHEYSYIEMFQISDLVSDGAGCALKLKAPIPLDLYVIDLGNGLQGHHLNQKSVTVKAVVSKPFRALLKGMLHEDLRYHRPRPVDLGGFFSVMSEQMFTPAHSGSERFGDRSYAIISDKYLNFSSRVGYHYSVLDCYCGQTPSKNYITFSFKGGAADDVRRSRRARAIAMILESLDFTVEVMADRVDARFQKFPIGITEEKLDMIGRLLQFTRQLDMLMTSDSAVSLIARAFLDGNYHLEPSKTVS